jgi:hypothetical protein
MMGGHDYYKGVWHLNQAIGANVVDSTINDVIETQHNSPTQGAGQIDGSLTYDGLTQYNSGTISSGLSGSFTFSNWVKNSNNTASLPMSLESDVSSYGNYWASLGFNAAKWTFALYDGSHNPYIQSTDTIGTGSWVYVVGVRNKATGKIYLYVNGVLQGDGVTDTTTSVPVYSDFYIGAQISQSGRYFLGNIDEARVSTVARSADWIKTEYNNQSSPSTFETLGSEELAVVPPGVPTGLTTNAGDTYINLSWTAPSSDSGSAITDYVIDYKLHSDAAWSTFVDGVSSNTTGTVTGLINGSSYDFRVSAVNISGQGNPSDEVSATPIGLPGAPTIRNAAAGIAQATVSFIPPLPSGSDPWFDIDWDYRMRLTVNPSQVPSAQSDFPVYVNLADLPVGFWSHVKSDGSDIRVTNSVGTELAREVVSIDTTSKTGELWFRSDSISNGTRYYIYCGNSGASEPNASDPVGSQKVWDDGYRGVWHLPNGTILGDGTNVYDSTSNTMTGTLSGTTKPTAIAGQIDGGANLNNAFGQYITMGNNLDISTGDFSIEYWFNAANTNQSSMIVGKRESASPFNQYASGIGYINNGGVAVPGRTVYFFGYNSDGQMQGVHTTNSIADGNWHHVVVTRSGSSAPGISIYIDGSSSPLTVDSTGVANEDFTNSSDFNIGYNNLNNYYNGKVDEVRISDIALSADRIKTEYNNQSSPSAFYTISDGDSDTGDPTITGYTVTSSPGGFTATGTSSPITVVGLVDNTTYTFTVTATNMVGIGPASAPSNPVTPGIVPDPPISLTAVSGNGYINLSWTIPSSDDGSGITDYVIEYKLSSQPTAWSVFSDGVSTNMTATVTSLMNGSSYDFRVSAVNAVGQGDSSGIAIAVPATIPTITTSIPTAVSTSTMVLNGIVTDTGGSDAIQSGFAYGMVSNLSTVTGTTTLGPQTGTSSFSGAVTGLAPDTLYYFRAYAVNSAGTSTGVIFSTTTLRWTFPGAPIIGTSSAGNATATVSFTAPIDNGGSMITGYIVTSSPGGITGVGSTSPITVMGLTNGASYTFTVTATNAAGTGPASEATSPSVTPATVPDPPTAVSVVGGPAQVTLSWSAPGFNGGSLITDYLVQYKLDASSTSEWSTFDHASSTATTTLITGLSNGQLYDFQVSAMNSVGYGNPSSPWVNSVPYTIPGKPMNVVATRDNAQSSVSFTAPLDDGGSTITSYTVTSDPDGQIGVGSASPMIVSNLTNGTPYTFTVTATNAAGTGPASDPSVSVTPATIPNAPTAVIVTAGRGQVGLAWTAPGSNGGSDITDYVIEFKLSASSTWSTFADGTSPATSATVIGLTNAQSYDFRVSAVNDTGQGSPSVQASAMPVTVPDAPTIGTATPGNASVSVEFAPPAFNGGSTINSYTVTSDPGGFTGIGSASPIIVAGLTNGTDYTFTVTATNAVGVGASSTSSNTVVPATVPDAPTTVVATPGNGQASVSFAAPSANGSPIISYTVTSSPGGIVGTGDASPIVVNGLTNGDNYQFTVTATNAVGISSPSSPSNQIKLSTEPSAPTNLAATVEGNSISLTWSAPSANGGSDISDYIVEYELTTDGTWSVFADGTSINTTALVTGLSDGTSYDLRVRAVNIIGQSDPSNTVIATPGEPAQVLVQSFSDLTVPTIGTMVRITNEGTSQYEYQYTWCVNGGADDPCGGAGDVFDSTAAKLIQPGTNYDMTATSTVPVPGNYWFHIKVDYGSQSSSASQSFTSLATYPDSPTSVVAASNASAQGTVSFAAPSANGSPIISYTVTSSPGGIVGTGDASPIVVNGLTNGTAYTFTVTATNGVGTSQASSPLSNIITPATIPDAPSGLTAAVGNTQVSLLWTAPAFDGGAMITDYVVWYKLSSDPTWSIFADGISTATTVIVTGLTNDLSYDFQVSAVNDVGQSLVNSTSATLPEPYQPPVVPSSEGSSYSSYSSSGSHVPVSIEGQPTVPTSIDTISASTSPSLSSSKTTMRSITKQTNISPSTTFIPSVNRKPITNEISATPTEHPTVLNKTANSSPWSRILWIVIIIIVGTIYRYRRCLQIPDGKHNKR